MTAFKTLDDIPAGQAGDMSRNVGLTLVEPHFYKGNDTEVEAGRAMEFASDGSVQYVTSGTATIGFTTRSYPAGSGYPESTKTPKGRAISVMRKGYMLVKCTNGKPVAGKPVHMYKQEYSGHHAGEFSAEVDSSYTSQLTGVFWASNGVDVNKLAEIQIL